jgi:hypothetical protein
MYLPPKMGSVSVGLLYQQATAIHVDGVGRGVNEDKPIAVQDPGRKIGNSRRVKSRG